MTGGASPRWSERQDFRLRELVGKGWSATEIGREIGKSRNAVIGRASRAGLRLGGVRKKQGRTNGSNKYKAERLDESRQNGLTSNRLVFRPNPTFVVGNGPKAPRFSPAKPALGMVKRVLDPAIAPPGALMVDLLDLETDMCRWPFEISIPSAKPKTRFCGLPIGGAAGEAGNACDGGLKRGGGAGAGSKATNGGDEKQSTHKSYCSAHAKRAVSIVLAEDVEAVE